MRSELRAVAASLIALQAVGCASGHVNSIWTDPSLSRSPYHGLLVVGIANNPTVQFAYEDNFVTALAKTGAKATPSHDLVVPKGKRGEAASIQQKTAMSDSDAVIVTHLVAEVSRDVEPTIRASDVPAFYKRLDTYYHQIDSDIRKADYYANVQTLRLETNLYDRKREALVWSGRSRPLDPNSEQTTIGQIIEDVIQQLTADGYLPRTSNPLGQIAQCLNDGNVFGTYSNLNATKTKPACSLGSTLGNHHQGGGEQQRPALGP
jgi:hypothetical protein